LPDVARCKGYSGGFHGSGFLAVLRFFDWIAVVLADWGAED
jgi:hypothetical protein